MKKLSEPPVLPNGYCSCHGITAVDDGRSSAPICGYRGSEAAGVLDNAAQSHNKSMVQASAQSKRISLQTTKMSSSKYNVTSTIILEKQNHYPRDAMLAWVFATATCLSVCHMPVLCQNKERFHDFFTFW